MVGLGGPLIVCDDIAAKNWSGTREGHYELAGSISDYLDIVTVAGNDYVSLWGDDLSATAIVREQRLFFIARLFYTSGIDIFEEKLLNFVNDYKYIESPQRKACFKSNNIYLMDATNNFRDSEINSFCSLHRVQKGIYEISTHEVDFDEENRVILHAFMETEYVKEIREQIK